MYISEMATRTATRTHPGDGARRRAGRRRRSAADALHVLRASIDASLPPAKKRAWTGALREIAGEAFVADREKRTVSWWATEMLGDLVAKKTVERWAQEDGWIARRERMTEVMREEVLHGIATEHARLLLRDLRALDELHEELVGQLSGLDAGGAVPPSFTSRAEAMRALVALDRRRDEKRRLIVDASPPTPAPAPVFSPEVRPLAPEVARAMAHARIRAEREVVERDAGESGS